jgi:hypothetical protein
MDEWRQGMHFVIESDFSGLGSRLTLFPEGEVKPFALLQQDYALKVFTHQGSEERQV